MAVSDIPSSIPDDTLRLERAALETSVAVLQRQRRTEQQLQQAKRELELLTAQQAQSLALLNGTLEASPDGVGAINLGGELIAWNRTFANVGGLGDDVLERRGADAVWGHCAAQIRQPQQQGPGVWWGAPGLRDEVEFHDGRIFERHVS